MSKNICMLCGTENRPEATHCKSCGATFTGHKDSISRKSATPTIVDSEVNLDSHKKTRIVSENEILQNSNDSKDPKKTVYISPQREQNDHVHSHAAHQQAPLAGFLVTYSWNPSGDWFLIREGKNTYGTHSECDGVITKDKAMSSKHFAIMCRNGEIRVRDLETTNATNVNGEEIWGDSCKGNHGTVIKAGDTKFTLTLIPKE